MEEKKRKKVIIKISVGFLILIAVLTLVSKTIDTMLLPAVTTVGVRSGKLNKNINTTGYLELVDTVIIKAGGDWNVEKVKIKSGDRVNEGTVLAVINKEKYHASIKKKDLERIRIENNFEIRKEEDENSIKELQDEKRLHENSLKILEITKKKESDIENIRLQLQKIENKINILTEEMSFRELEYKKEIDILEDELQELKYHFPNAGTISSKISGTIKTVYIQDEAEVKPGDELFEIISDDTRYAVVCYLNFPQVSLLEIGSDIVLETKYPRNALIDGSVTSIEYDLDRKQYRLQSEIEDADILEKEKNMEGLGVGVTFLIRTATYKNIIPNRVIKESTEKGNFIYVLAEKENNFSTRTNVRTIIVKVLDSDDFDSAVESIFLSTANNGIVDTVSKPISDGAQVRIE